jgi:hypothetical protein
MTIADDKLEPPEPAAEAAALDQAIAGILSEIEREPVPERLLKLAGDLQRALRDRRALAAAPEARPGPSAPG